MSTVVGRWLPWALVAAGVFILLLGYRYNNSAIILIAIVILLAGNARLMATAHASLAKHRRRVRTLPAKMPPVQFS